MKKKILAIFMATMMSVSIAACGSSGESADTEATPGVTEEAEATPEATPETTVTPEVTEEIATPTQAEQVIAPYESDLTSGAYYVGFHIPEGVYNVTVNSGVGNILTKTGITSALGSASGVSYADSYNNLTLANGDVLTVTQSLNIKLSTQEAYYSTMQPYDNPATEPVELSAGSYVIGQDVPAGIYDMVATGDLVTVNTSDLNVNASLTNNETLAVSSAISYKNAELLEGATLTVQSGSVTLTPTADITPLTPQ